MQNDMLLIFAILFVVVFCLVIGYTLFLRPLRELRSTTIEMKTLLAATQTALAQSQQETATLRRALTATNVQGQWGEIQLKRIVELSGMLPYCDFEEQVQLKGENGGSQRPDLLVRLSNGRTIVVDAKAPINSYVQAFEGLDEMIKASRFRQYAHQVRSHVTRLASKEYWKHFEPSPEWVVLLIPNEGMFRVALENDPYLLDESIQKNVLLASPITLLALLKAVAYGWQQEKRAQNVQQVIKYSHTLQRELGKFMAQWQKLYKEVKDTTTIFNQCMAHYQTTVFPIVQQICELEGKIDVGQYDLSRFPPLHAPNLVEDLLMSAQEASEIEVVVLSEESKETDNQVKNIELNTTSQTND